MTNGRRFNSNFFYRDLPNGEKVDRTWLHYSQSKNLMFCYPCKLLAPKKDSQLASGGCNDWKNAVAIITRHETLPAHLKTSLDWYETRQRIKNLTGIDAIQLSRLAEEKRKWRNILLRIIEVIKFLATHNIPFQGSTGKLNEDGNGNFLGVIELLANFDPVLQAHIHDSITLSICPTYFSYQTQN